MALWQWSKVPINNQNADPTINWTEGQAPSTLNDSDRAMMSRIAEYRDDISGSLSLAGGPVSYTVTTNQGLPSTPTTGQLLSFTPNVVNGTNSTIAADGGTAFPIQVSPGVPLASGTLIVGTPYSASFSGAAWVLFSTFTNPLLIPVGGMILWPAASLPNTTNFGWPNGQALSRSTYAALFGLIGTYYGNGLNDGLTFSMPNLNGVGLFVQDGMGGSAQRGAITTGNGNWNSSSLGAPFYGAGGTVGRERVFVAAGNLPAHAHGFTINSSTGINATNYQAVSGAESQQHQHGGGAAAPGQIAGGGVGNLQNAVTAQAATAVENQGHTHTTDLNFNGTTTDGGPGSGSGIPTVPPGISLPVVMRIL